MDPKPLPRSLPLYTVLMDLNTFPVPSYVPHVNPWAFSASCSVVWSHHGGTQVCLTTGGTVLIPPGLTGSGRLGCVGVDPPDFLFSFCSLRTRLDIPEINSLILNQKDNSLLMACGDNSVQVMDLENGVFTVSLPSR
ncbi:hypothetical protein chiPu_0024824 [Chiloscyllium punctatum]|uniref:Uncharacterized protein n=1 Tax=Chiloscyllium punctatum TaxID=137246 RepID=A0A401TDJ7_CHIPU|nr:hypothetical protein [Chiloscyllium punctatum]